MLTSASFLPHYGGPAYSVRSLANQLVACGLDVAIWAPDGSAAYQTDRSFDESRDQVLALQGSLNEALSIFGTPNIFHDSGLWWRHNWTIAAKARQLRKPAVVSVRGMLEPAALRHRAWKKRVAWHLYQRKNLENAAALHVTGELEAQNLRTLGLRSKIVCIPNGLFVPKKCRVRSPARKKLVVFLGRLHPIKGLPMLLDAWARIRPLDWSLVIAGPDEEGHRRALENQVSALALTNAVCFVGPVNEVEKRALLARASVFILPSHSENFGIAAGEALADGLPVIATRGTPWSSLESERCGWYVAASVDGIELGLRNAFATPQEELIEMGRRGFVYVSHAFSWSRVGDDMVTLYRSISV
jgi:glycosyltransferase involved in cell wall biosynthesis